MFSTCPHIALLFEGYMVIYLLGLFCSHDIQMATYPPFFFSVEINDEVKRHAALLRENDPLLIDKNLLLICHEVAP